MGVVFRASQGVEVVAHTQDVMFVIGPAPSAPALISKPEFPSGSTMAHIQNRGYLKVAVVDQIAGFSFYGSTGSLQGFEIDWSLVLARAIFGGEALSDAAPFVQFTTVEFGERDEYVTEAMADVVLGNYANTPTRRKFAEFGGHYMFAPQSALVGPEVPNFSSGNDMNGMRICAIAGTADLATLPVVAPHAEIVEYTEIKQCLSAVSTGEVQGFWANTAGNSGFARYEEGGFTHATVRFGGERLGAAIRKGDLEFTDFVDKTVASAFDSGELVQSMTRWIGR